MANAQILLVADSPNNTAVVQEGQPPAQMGAWLVDVADGQQPLAAAAAWVGDKTFQTGTVMHVVVDLGPMQSFTLEPQWVPVT